jgi:hypothetical protein
MRDIIIVFAFVIIVISLYVYQQRTSIAVARERLESTWSGPTMEGFVDVIADPYSELPDPADLIHEDGYTGKGHASARSSSYDLLAGGLPQPRKMEGPDSHACYMSIENQFPRPGGSYSQCTNHVNPKKITESCSAPNHDFVNTFYKA